MLDMGGVASTSANTEVDTGKNHKIRCIALDFNVITRSVESQNQEAKNTLGSTDMTFGENILSKRSPKESVKPNVSIVQNFADLLGVNLGGDITLPQKSGGETDDLSQLTGKSEDMSKTTNKSADARDNLTMDVRVKYAKKLRSRVEGGLAGVELAISQREEASKKGDAPGNLVARQIAASQVVSTSGPRWLAKTGTGTLLTFLNQRSMKIVLMPLPTLMDTRKKDEEGVKMDNFAKQLPKIKFNLLMKGLKDNNGTIEKNTDAILSHILESTNVPPISTLVVSDRDDYLLAAKNRGLFTCRVKQKNAPRGNVTTNYNVEDIAEVEDIVNEANGISFNTIYSKSHR